MQGRSSWNAAWVLLRIARGLAMLLDEHATLEWEHVKAHADHPWNELVDCAAKDGARGIKHDQLAGDFD